MKKPGGRRCLGRQRKYEEILKDAICLVRKEEEEVNLFLVIEEYNILRLVSINSKVKEVLTIFRK